MPGGERIHTKNHSRRTIPERTEGNNPHLASEKQVGWPNRCLLMPFIPHGVAGFSCPDPATTQLNKCLCMDWTTPSAPACTSAASSHLSDETMAPLWHNPSCYFTAGRSLCRTSGESPCPFRTGSRGSNLRLCIRNQKAVFSQCYSIRYTHTGSTPKELRCQTKCIS